MPSVQEPYRLEGRTAIVVGPADELSRHITAALTAAGVSVSRTCPEFPLPPASNGALEAADILVLQTFVDPGDAIGGGWEAIDRLHRLHIALPIALMAKWAPAMSRRHWGRVLFLAGGEALPAAIAIQSAQSALMQAEARRLAAAGITVNLITVNSSIAALSTEAMDAIASAALYFVSDETGFVTGQTLQIGCDVRRV